MILDIMAVLAVVQDTHAIVALRQVRPAVRHRLKLRLIPARIPVVRAAHIAVLHVIRSVSGSDIHRECRLEKLMLFMEIYFCPEINSPVIAVKDHILSDV